MKKDSKSGATNKDAQPKSQPKEKALRKTKFKVDMDAARVKAMFKEHKTVSATALALGFPKGKGNNRTHAALCALGLVGPRKGAK
jgi:hypothetical protein